MTAQTPSRGSRTLKDTSGRSPLCVSHTSARCCGVYTCPAASARSTAYAPGWHAHARVGYTYNGAFGWESFLGCACCMLHRACCMLHVASCMLHRACCMLHRAWQLVGSRSVGCTCAGLGSASEDEARRGRAWRGKRQGAARPVGCAGEVSAHEGRPSMHMPAALPIGIPPALVIARARSIQRGARGQSALSCLNSVPWV